MVCALPLATRALCCRRSRHGARRTLGRGRGDGVCRSHPAQPGRRGQPERDPPLPSAHAVRPADRNGSSRRNPRNNAAALDALPACAAVRAARATESCESAQRAAIDILPFQLEPVLALVRGHASRLLLADEVGLGKTIQAGLMLAELLQRGWCDRALIVTPAGLRHQWADELLRRFDIRAAVIDAASLAARADSLPFDVNPWTVEPVAITSIDFVKQPEVLRGLTPESWDLLIVDEAHQATAASLRYDAVDALARRARHVVLLTATPHAGDEHAYRALCAIGRVAEDDPILLFRRTRGLSGLPRSRRAHLLPVRLTRGRHRDASPARQSISRSSGPLPAASGNRDVQLVAMILAKRAFSSARSLAISLERRLAALAEPSRRLSRPRCRSAAKTMRRTSPAA